MRPASGVPGELEVDRVQLDRYLLFASTFDGAHGAQWVGPGGGQGDHHNPRCAHRRGLGPYRWPVFAGHPAYAAGLWSGGARTRPAATPVRVRAGQVARSDAALGRGTLIAGIIAGASGRLPDSVDVAVVNAVTYDQIALVQAGPDGRYAARVAGPKPVKLLLGTDFRGVMYARWYRDAAQFKDGRTFAVPPSGTLPLDLTVAD